MTTPSRFSSTSTAVAILLMFAAPVYSDGVVIEVLSPGIEAITFTSRVLRQRKTFCVVTPAKAKRNLAKWPVLVMLHGRGRSERSLIDDAQTKKMLLAAAVVTVLPDGDDGWYINSPVVPRDRYSDYLEELLGVATASCELNTNSAAWGVSGWSMGGYGCVMFAQAHPQRFRAIAPVIGLLDFPRDDLPEGQRYAVPTKRFGEDPRVWKRMNPISRVERLRGRAILVITAAQAFDRTMNEHFRDRLNAAHISHRYQQLAGGHTFETVRRALPHVLTFMETSLSR